MGALDSTWVGPIPPELYPLATPWPRLDHTLPLHSRNEQARQVPAASIKQHHGAAYRRPSGLGIRVLGLGFGVAGLGKLRPSADLEGRPEEAGQLGGGGGRRGGDGAAGRAVVESGWARSGRGDGHGCGVGAPWSSGETLPRRGWGRVRGFGARGRRTSGGRRRTVPQDNKR